MNKIKILTPYIKPYFIKVILLLLLTLPIGAIDAYIVTLLKPFMDVLLLKQAIESSINIAGNIILITIIQALLSYFTTYWTIFYAQKIAFDVKIALYERLMNKNNSYFDNKTSGDILKSFHIDVEKAFGDFFNFIKNYFQRFFCVVSLGVVLFLNCPKLAFISILFFGFALMPITQIKAVIKKSNQNFDEANSKTMLFYNETHKTNKFVTSYNLKDTRVQQLKEFLNDYFHSFMKIIRYTAWTTPLIRIISSIGLGLILILSTKMIAQNEITSGNFIAFITALILLFNPLKQMGHDVKNIQTCLFALENVLNELKYDNELQEKKKEFSFNNEIEFKNVSFEYKKNEPILNNISLKIKKGQKIAFIGSSGCGKTTLISLFNRLYDISNGQILFDGINIQEFNLKSLRDKVSIVFQDNFIFSGTIRQNLLLVKPNATQQELIQALKNAYLWDFVISNKNGLDMKISENATTLSGGQKQRLALARAFLKDGDIFIFDESTNSLDANSEKYIKQAIENLSKNKTIIIVTHKSQNLKNIDNVFIVENGKVNVRTNI